MLEQVQDPGGGRGFRWPTSTFILYGDKRLPYRALM